MALNNETRRRWWSSYETLNAELDKLTDREFNFLLKSKILDADSHTADSLVHVSKEERKKWDSFNGFPATTKTKPGLITQPEKDKLNSIADQANNYKHPRYTGSSKLHTYTYKVNNLGHITDVVDNHVLPVAVNNVSFFDGLDYSKFFNVNNKNFKELKLPTVDITKTENRKKLVNVQALRRYCIPSAITISDSFRLERNRLIYHRPTNTLYYFKTSDNAWTKIVSLNVNNMVELDSNGKINKSELKTGEMPLGSIITTMTHTGEIDPRYIPCDGRTIKRDDYPELFDQIDKGIIFTISYAELERLFTERNQGTRDKSWYAFVRPEDDSSDKIIVPKMHNVTLRAESNVYSRSVMFRKESTRRIYGEMPVFNFYSNDTNTVLKTTDVNQDNSVFSTTEELTFVQDPFDQWSAYDRDNNGITAGGSFYSYKYQFEKENNPNMSELVIPISNGYMNNLKEKHVTYTYDNNVVYNTGDENCPAITKVMAFVKVKRR